MNRMAQIGLACVLACLAVAPAQGDVFEIAFTGTVDGDNTPFGNGTAVAFTVRYDTADVQVSPVPGIFVDFVETTDATLTIGGVAQTGVEAGVYDFDISNMVSQIVLTWDGPPSNPDLTIDFPLATNLLDFREFSAADVTAGTINNNGNPLDTLAATSFSATLVPEPASLALLGLGGLMVARRRRKR